MLADEVDVVIGVDTHKRTHTAAVVSANGLVLEQVIVPADQAGYRRLVALADGHGRGSGRWREPAPTGLG